ncbi:MAG: hypothetical protein JW856_01585 [Dehalococcoidales bacterium]|nr:hypothetical protein [Dehalococcoidales bacterium]
MQDEYYGDKRDLVKWSGLFYLCKDKNKRIRNIMWVLFYVRTEWEKVKIQFDGEEKPLQKPVVKHFRSLGDIKKLGEQESVDIILCDEEFRNDERSKYMKNVVQKCKSLRGTKIVFLDPDNGLASPNSHAKVKHVTSDDVARIWSGLKHNDLLVIYQHFFRKSSWKQEKRRQFADACGCPFDAVHQWDAQGIAKDVVFFYAKKK